jgi:hypothetical protein
MSFFKHVGVANNKKVIIIQRTIPGEDHMSAVLYSDILPSRYHDDVMAVLESPEGQASYEFRDILQRRMGANGDNLLQTLSSENFIKRVPQNAVIVKPNSKSSIRLDELVKLLTDAGRGEDAVRRLDEMDNQLGMTDDVSQTNTSRNTAKKTAKTLAAEKSDSVKMEPTAVVDQNALMMQMMQTMQQMQKELAEMKKPATVKKTTKAKPAA